MKSRSETGCTCRLSLIAIVGLVAAALTPGQSAAQTERVAGFQPRAFAIVRATIVPRPGEKLDNADLLIRNGMIVQVGQGLEVPADAKVIEGEGLHVYAGFVDAGAGNLLDENQKPKTAEGRKIDFSRYVLAATRPDNRHSMTPELLTADALKSDAATYEAFRKHGFTSVHALPAGRVASGQGVLLETSGAPLRETLLLEKTFAQFQLFAPGGSEYPSTLMGATAHLRQAFLDARRYRQHHDLHAAKEPDSASPGDRSVSPGDRSASPGDRSVSRGDRTLAALDGVLRRRQRALFLAETRDDIHRALDLAGEFDIQPAVWGGREAWRAAERLKEQKADVIAQVDFGAEPKIEVPKATDELTAEVKQPLRVQRDERARWRERVAGLAALKREKIRFAVSSRGLKNGGEVLSSLRTAIAEGFSRDDALAALTSDAAAILGLDDQLGTLAAGKLAHVVVLTGPFDHEKSQVRHVFTGGAAFEYNKEAKPVVVEETPPSQEPVAAPVPSIRPTELESDRLRRPIQTGGNVFIKNATVLTGQAQTLSGASILVKDGKIVAISEPDSVSSESDSANREPDSVSSEPDSASPEPGVHVIDAAGSYVMPGIIDTHSHIMITAGINEATQSIVPEVRIKDVVNTADASEYRALAGGVTTARIFHGSANVIGGQDAVVKLRHGGTAAEHILHDAPQGVKFALGENVKFRTWRFPNTRLGVEATLNRAFMEAIDYRRVWTEHERRQSAAAEELVAVLPPRRDLRLEALADIVDHKKFIHSHCYRSDEILMLLRVASDLGVRVWSLQHVLEGYKVAPEIVAHGASCSTFADWWAYKVEAFDATPHNAALLQEAGANVVVKSDDWELIRHLYLEAAKTVRYGNMHPDHALQAITRNPARELGLGERLGTIEVGKDADLAIFSGHPLNAFSRCEMTLIDGEVYFVREQAPSAMSAAAAKASSQPPPLVFPTSEVRSRSIDLTVSPNGRYAIVGATLHPVDGEDIAAGTIVIDAGKIAAIGSNVATPNDATIIDGTDLHVSPGLIDAGTTLGLVEIGKVRETHDAAEGGNFQPDLRAGVAINPDSELLPVARAGGITTILMRPTAGIIAGQASLARPAGWTAAEMVLDYEQGLQLNWPGEEKQVDELKDFLDDARLYVKLTKAAEAAGQAPPIGDPRFDALRPYLDGTKPVFVEADSRKQIAEALLFAEKEKLKIIITGGTQAWLLADELKKRNVPVIVGPVMRRPVDTFDPFDAPYANPGRLYEAGVKFCIRSNNASNSRNAPFEAAMAVAYGLPAEAGLRAVTLSAAEILGVDDRLGSLTPGKQANLVISDGSLLQQTTQIKGVFIDGKPFAPESRQTRFYERYRQRLHEHQQEQGKETAN